MRGAALPQALLVAGALAFACERGSTAESRAPTKAIAAPPETDDGSTATDVAENPDDPEAVASDGGEPGDAAVEELAEPGSRCAPTFTKELLTILGPIDGLAFEYDKAVIRPQSYAVLDHIVEVLRDNPEILIQIDGHRDDDPHWRERAVDITRRRAESVRRYLIDKGIAADRLEARGFGPTHPLVPNDTKENRARNRRIELHAPEVSDDVVLCPD